MPQSETPDTNDIQSLFENAKTLDAVVNAIDDIMEDPEFPSGRTKLGFGYVNIGLFGGHPATDDPTEFHHEQEDYVPGGAVLTTVREYIDEFGSDDSNIVDLMYPSKTSGTEAGSVGPDGQFRTYQSPVYVQLTDQHPSRIEDLCEQVAGALDEADSDEYREISAVDFSLSTHSLGEMFRAVYPWAKYDAVTDEDTTHDRPAPLGDLIATLRKHPPLPEYHVLTVTLYVPSSRTIDCKFQPEFFDSDEDEYGEFRYILDTDPRDNVTAALQDGDPTVERHNITYTLTLTLDDDEITTAIDGDQHYYVDSVEDYAKLLGRKYHERTYGDERGVTVGVQDIEDTENGDTTIEILVSA